MQRLPGITLLLSLLVYSGNALALRPARPEDIAYWKAYGPMWILVIGVVSVLLVVVIWLTLLMNRRRKDRQQR